MKSIIRLAFAAIVAVALTSTPETSRAQSLSSLPNLSSVVNVPVIYEFKPQSIGVLARVQIGRIPVIGGDIDTLAGLASPTKNLVLGKSFADLSGQAGFGVSWSWTEPKTNYYLRAGVGVLQVAGGQPQGSIYAMIGIR